MCVCVCVFMHMYTCLSSYLWVELLRKIESYSILVSEFIIFIFLNKISLLVENDAMNKY